MVSREEVTLGVCALEEATATDAIRSCGSDIARASSAAFRLSRAFLAEAVVDLVTGMLNKAAVSGVTSSTFISVGFFCLITGLSNRAAVSGEESVFVCLTRVIGGCLSYFRRL